MFKFFKREDVSNELSKTKHIACISYKIDENNKVIIDMEVANYDKKSMSALFYLLDIIADDRCAYETSEILSEHLNKNNQAVWIEELKAHLEKNKNVASVKKIYDDFLNSMPCIRPLDILK